MRKVIKLRLVFILILLVTFGCRETQIMSEENIKQENTPSAEPVSIPALERFIFKPDEFNDSIVPRGLDPAEVAKFLIQKIDKEASLEVFIQVEKVADFYDPTEVVEKFRQFLDKKESGSEAVRRSIVITRIIAVLGKPDDIDFARAYYKYLVSKIDTINDFEEIIFLHEDLNLGKNSGELRGRLQAKLASLEQKKATDNDARLDYLKLQEEIEAKIRGVEEVQPIKDRVLQISDRKKRVEEEIKIYVTSEYGFISLLQPWAARRIRRETWGAQPAEQIKRTDNSQLKADVAKLLDDFLKKIDDLPDLEPEEKEFAKIRTLRAIKFFGGKIPDSEENFLNERKNKQVDILANEGFLIKE
ncbi:hypothetical protein BH10ACI1_BH10ACI1_07780 [soil metagenome]